MTDKKPTKHIVLTTHSRNQKPTAIHWGAKTPTERGPVIATLTSSAQRNVIGTHSGAYSLYRALAVASGALEADHKADLTNTSPPEKIGPFPQWQDPEKIVSIDPYGAIVGEAFKDYFDKGFDIRPTIAITKAHINMPELGDAMKKGRIKADGKIVSENGDVLVTKAAIEPVWYLPGIAKRFGCEESELRRIMFEHTGGMFPELVTRPDLEVFLPPIGGMTVYMFGDVSSISDPNHKLACRVHDECNGSDVFGSDICTCRPYLVHGIEVCIKTAQEGGAGVIVYSRKEGRALGEVTKFLVYNARKRQVGGDRADAYFTRTECVAGVQDMRFQELMPDVLHWLGVTKIDLLVSMSNLKYEPLVKSGINVVQRVPIPDDLIPLDARVEMEAKKAAGYYNEETTKADLSKVKGRGLNE